MQIVGSFQFRFLYYGLHWDVNFEQIADGAEPCFDLDLDRCISWPCYKRHGSSFTVGGSWKLADDIAEERASKMSPADVNDGRRRCDSLLRGLHWQQTELAHRAGSTSVDTPPSPRPSVSSGRWSSRPAGFRRDETDAELTLTAAAETQLDRALLLTRQPYS